ncbi:MAG: hypothetical protein OXT67_00105 [Zetaproteobacteria bacterium]|nr:hypothetical protein [Zetaproteobacteria bacterium]
MKNFLRIWSLVCGWSCLCEGVIFAQGASSAGEAPSVPAEEASPQAGEPAAASTAAEGRPGALDSLFADKLQLAVAYLVSRKSVEGSSWKARGMTDIYVRYADPAWAMQAVKVGGFFRYAPDAVQPKVESTDGYQREYSGIVEEYILGVDFAVALQTNLALSTGVGLGFARSKLYALQDSGNNEAPKKNYDGILLSGQVHLDYYIAPEWSVAPVFYFGLGAFREYQLGGRFSFLF